MSIADNPRHRQAWLRRLATVQGQIRDLEADIDVAFQPRPLPPTATMHSLAEAYTHLSVALVELDEARMRVNALP